MIIIYLGARMVPSPQEQTGLEGMRPSCNVPSPCCTYKRDTVVPKFFNYQGPSREDDNLGTAQWLKRQTGGRDVGIPERPFKWLVASHHVDATYQPEGFRHLSPWYMRVRCLMFDLPEQLEHDAVLRRWRDYQVGDPQDDKIFRRTGKYKDIQHWKWGRRVVFSEQAKGEPGLLTGRWLVVAYVWGQSQEWLRQVNVKTLVSFDTAFCIRGFEHVPHYSSKKWQLFYEFQRRNDIDNWRRLFYSQTTIPSDKDPPPVALGVPLPEDLSRLYDLMNRKAGTLFYAAHETDNSHRTQDVHIGGASAPMLLID